jgi:poly(3-hydroxybutyrate) depolymerase
MPPVTPSMIYQAYRTQADYLDLVRPLAAAAGSALRLPWPRLGQDWPLHRLAGVLETFANLTVIHARLPFGIESVPVGNQLVPVTEEAVYSTPFATLLHFKKATGAAQRFCRHSLSLMSGIAKIRRQRQSRSQ